LDFHKNFSTAFADLNSAIDLMTAEGDSVVILSTWNAIHQGDELVLPPTGKQVAHGQQTLSGKIMVKL